MSSPGGWLAQEKLETEDFRILKLRVADVHPDKGGTHQEAVKATAEFNAFKDRLKREERQRAEWAAAEAAKREKQKAHVCMRLCFFPLALHLLCSELREGSLQIR